MSIELLLVLLAFVGLGAVASRVFTRTVLLTDAGQAALLSPAANHGRRRAAVAFAGAAAVTGILLLAGPWLAHAVAGRVGPTGPTGLSLALTPLAIGVAHAGVFLAAERTWPRPAAPVREATLRPRSYTRFAPRWLAAIACAWIVGLAVTLAWTGTVATDNQLQVGYDGSDPRWADQVTGPADFGWAAAGPFPGWGYGVPTLTLAAALAVLVWLTLREVQRRPAVPGLEGALDDDLRRTSARQVLGVAQAALGVTLAGNLFFVSSALRGVRLASEGVAVLVLAIAVAATTLTVLGLAIRRR